MHSAIPLLLLTLSATTATAVPLDHSPHYFAAPIPPQGEAATLAKVDDVAGAVDALCGDELNVDCPEFCSSYADPLVCLTKHFCVSLSGPLVWTAGPDTTRGLVGAGAGVPAPIGGGGSGSGLGAYAGVQLVGTSGIECPK